MRSLSIFSLILLLIPAALFSRGMDIVEIDADSHLLYFLYHYEPRLIMGQIFGSSDLNELGYTIGPYWSNQSFSIELPVGVCYSTEVPITQTHWKTKLNWFAALPSWDNPQWEITSINGFSWGVNGNSNTYFNKWELLFTPRNVGLRMQSFTLQGERFSPFIGAVKRVNIGKSVSFLLYQGRKLENNNWLIQLNVFFKYFSQ